MRIKLRKLTNSFTIMPHGGKPATFPTRSNLANTSSTLTRRGVRTSGQAHTNLGHGPKCGTRLGQSVCVKARGHNGGHTYAYSRPGN